MHDHGKGSPQQYADQAWRAAWVAIRKARLGFTGKNNRALTFWFFCVKTKEQRFLLFFLIKKVTKKSSLYLPLKNYVTILPSRPKPLAKADRDCVL